MTMRVAGSIPSPARIRAASGNGVFDDSTRSRPPNDARKRPRATGATTMMMLIISPQAAAMYSPGLRPRPAPARMALFPGVSQQVQILGLTVNVAAQPGGHGKR